MKRKDVHHSTWAIYNRHKETNPQKRKQKFSQLFTLISKPRKKTNKNGFLVKPHLTCYLDWVHEIDHYYLILLYQTCLVLMKIL